MTATATTPAAEATTPTLRHRDDVQGLRAIAVPVSYTHLTLPTIYSV